MQAKLAPSARRQNHLRIANIMKNNATEQELVSFAKGVLDVHQGREGLC